METTALHDTPTHHCGIPTATYHPGDRVTDIFDTPAGLRRYIGTVKASTGWVFSVDWDNHPGTATYSHSHEPDTLRYATPNDERVLTGSADRLAVAAELRHAVKANPGWPERVRGWLLGRAHDIDGCGR